MAATTTPRPIDLGLYLVGVAALAACLTILWASTRAVMDIGGMCASGGPYVIARQCPRAWTCCSSAPSSGASPRAHGGLFGSRIGPGFGAVAALAWPALFLSLGWDFLGYGFAAPGWDWSWLLCGVLFVAMGGTPLVIGVRGMRGRTGRAARWEPPSLGQRAAPAAPASTTPRGPNRPRGMQSSRPSCARSRA